MKHILRHTVNETLGKGSVILIKGTASNGETYLYATCITGYANMHSNVNMVFLGDTMWRVVVNERGKFAGHRVAYESDGIRQALNLKNQTTHSIVLNNNKTPLHWITRNFTDIATALREVEHSIINLKDLNLT